MPSAISRDLGTQLNRPERRTPQLSISELRGYPVVDRSARIHHEARSSKTAYGGRGLVPRRYDRCVMRKAGCTGAVPQAGTDDDEPPIRSRRR